MSKTEWDYSSLAAAYVKRPDYSDAAIDAIVDIASLRPGDRFCDVGAGTGILTRALLIRGLKGIALEPNDAMRAFGSRSTPQVDWIDAVAENTRQPHASFDLVSFGSSFNVTERATALAEAARILRPRGWLACLWNHRVLDDPLQSEVEAIIRSEIADYSYGTRREDQTEVIEASGLFGPVVKFEGQISHRVAAMEWADAWASHSTLARQANGAFATIVHRIRKLVEGLGEETIEVPYVTRVWISRLAA